MQYYCTAAVHKWTSASSSKGTDVIKTPNDIKKLFGLLRRYAFPFCELAVQTRMW